MKSCIYYLHKGDHKPFYVGETKNKGTRLNAHKSEYGLDTKMEIISEVKNWRRWEKYYIKKYRDLGYDLKNINSGGGGVAKGTPKPEGFGARISAIKKKLNWKPSKEQILKANKAKMKKTLQYTLEGVFIAEYESSKAAVEAVGVHEVVMRHHLRGTYKTCRGFKFKYEKDLEKNI